MSYTIYLKMKEDIMFPVKWTKEISHLKELLKPDYFNVDKDQIIFSWSTYWYDFMSVLVGHQQEFKEFYYFVKENMEIIADCHNPTDSDYGPDSWKEFDQMLKAKMQEVK